MEAISVHPLCVFEFAVCGDNQDASVHRCKQREQGAPVTGCITHSTSLYPLELLRRSEAVLAVL